MANNIATNVEQSFKLFELLGIDPNTASMTWGKTCETGDWKLYCIPYKSPQKEMFYVYKPAWTLEDLLDLLPDNVKYDSYKCYLFLHKDNINYTAYDSHRDETLNIVDESKKENETLIDVAVRVIEELKERELM